MIWIVIFALSLPGGLVVGTTSKRCLPSCSNSYAIVAAVGIAAGVFARRRRAR